MNQKSIIQLPPNKNGSTSVEVDRTLLIIGANGSGKTRLGAWIELQSGDKSRVHRISAQRSLAMPSSTTTKSIEEATSALLNGHEDAIKNGNIDGYKMGHRWGNNPATKLLDDFYALMVFLFSDYADQGTKYLDESRKTKDKLQPPITKIEQVKELWEKILPHRKLDISNQKIQTQHIDSNKIYNSSEMSDGERVIFYLIGQCLAAKENSIIVIDEPEIHLHKSVQTTLWNEIQNLRSDCIFVYITHDVDFASTHENATKVWLKSYVENSWDWETINNSQLPDELLYQVLGSRKQVIFVEGETGSNDSTLYRELFSNYLIIPRGSCTSVIQSVRAFKANPQFHNLNVLGLIDRDRRNLAEINALESDGIFVLKVAEVENLFCVKEILKLVCERISKNFQDTFNEIIEFTINKLQSEFDAQVSLIAINEIKYQLGFIDEKAKNLNEIKSKVNALFESIDIEKIYKDICSEFQTIITDKNYDRLLEIYNRKSLASQVSSKLGLLNGELPEMVIRLLRDNTSREDVRSAMKPYFGNFSSHL